MTQNIFDSNILQSQFIWQIPRVLNLPNKFGNYVGRKHFTQNLATPINATIDNLGLNLFNSIG